MVRGLSFPVPDPALPFLGVHTTRRVDGDIWLGPNAVLAFARAGYRFSSVNLNDLAGIVAWPGFWRMARRYWKTSLGEMYRDLDRRAFVRELRRYLPDLRPEDGEAGPSGVRAQAVARSGALVDGFGFTGAGRSTAATVTPPFDGTPMGQCVTRAFVNVIVPPFDGPDVEVPVTVTLKPSEKKEAPPAKGKKK